jgi:hypothetical protein
MSLSHSAAPSHINERKFVIESPDIVILAQQRSGTHFLQSSLSQHPRIQTRGEFVLHYQRMRAKGIPNPENEIEESCAFRYRRRQGFVNVGIVMYSQLGDFEELCGPLMACRIIHLIRNPECIARSLIQMDADRKILGKDFRAHYHSSDELVLPPLTDVVIEEKIKKVAGAQAEFVNRLAGCPNVLTVTYEELTQNSQVNILDAGSTRKLLDFLNLDMHVLSTKLIKSSLRGTGINKLTVGGVPEFDGA